MNQIPGPDSTSLQLAQRLFAAIEQGDVEASRELYDANARIWHNTDNVEQTVEQNLRVLRWLVRNTAQRRYEDVRREQTASGFVQLHVLRLHFHDGRVVHVPACLVAQVRAGLITRIDEYLDSAHTAAISA